MDHVGGPNPPIDQSSVENYKDEQSVQFLKDETVKQKLASTLALEEVKASDYDAVFYVGGCGISPLMQYVILIPGDLGKVLFLILRPTPSASRLQKRYLNIMASIPDLT